MTESVPALREAAARQAIARAAAATGTDFSALLATARRESALNPAARAGTSSASGMFQFIESTWLDMVRRHGAEHGLGQQAQALRAGPIDAATRAEILQLRFDPELSARMAGELWRENAQFLEGRLHRAPNASELYAAHVIGPQGAARLIAAAETGDASAAALFPREAAANRALFYDRAGAPRSAGELLQRLALDVGGATAAPVERAAAPSEPRMGSSAPLSPALLDALMALALAPSLVSAETDDPALNLLRREPI